LQHQKSGIPSCDNILERIQTSSFLFSGLNLLLNNELRKLNRLIGKGTNVAADLDQILD
jgi:hypothetical protein